MLAAVYKSSKKADTYLFIEKRDDFSKVPDPLMATFGTPIFVIIVDLAKRTKLGVADLSNVKQKLIDDGFYLQLPPPQENLLDELKRQNGVKSD
ncbi:YcgL domain-containing protein [Pseudoalteromonas rubra]|uniref:YcgL domain-containing protein C3B51_11450 n=2 Tax=Pseudoalteromonas TaxID=53246 RepID=A0A4Q7EGJ8_9GAMM|nr:MULTISPECIES: YcgL domain-containing protein [Pseudoalteromonas]AZZ95973.1 YcgL domain-containing protein [Pseudoalteromonas sp. R3]MCF2906889.1 YcgL domain-containing protein [Pseudoalteromonas sp. DL2-H2.2]MCG7535424.1 YcgL domain-containing protein [Pseudoalteromonas sp. OOF1S-7]MCO7187647.1 YcgL domain-containing protein [Pseudoalteromonas sp. XMcav2-N]QTL38022.1 YcgL domain-containing protein [Pseudoalteromonas viridis]